MRPGMFALMAAVMSIGPAAASPAADEKRPADTAAQEEVRATQTKPGWEVRAGAIHVDPASNVLTARNNVEFVLANQPDAPVRGAFLGVSTTPADPVVQKQLQLKPGVGLVVDSVESGSPAEQAGVKQYDLLHKLDEQLLINGEQLAVLIRSHEPGKEVKLTVIREGKSQTLSAKLGEREVQPLRLWFHTPANEQTLIGQQSHVLNIAGKVNEIGLEGAGTLVLTGPQEKAAGAAQITIEDAEHKMTITRPDGRKHLKVEDKSGKTLFEGAIETKEELDKVPAEFREAYQEVMKSATPADAGFAAPAPALTPGDEGKK
jgi:hypothetical protein